MEKTRPILYGVTNYALLRKKNGCTVTLHRLVLVFHGGDCVLAEEV